MSNDITVTVQEEDITVTVQEEDVFAAYTSNTNPAYVNSIDDVGDIDVTTNGKVDGSVLVYKSNTNKWTATRSLDQQIVDAGEF